MYKILLALLIFITINATGQTTKLKIEVSISDSDNNMKENNYYLLVLNKSDTVLKKELKRKTTLEVDTMKPGKYEVQIFKSKDQKAPYIVEHIIVLPSKLTEIFYDLSISQSHSEIDSISGMEIKKVKYEGQVDFSYFKTDWINDNNSIITTNGGMGATANTWFAFSKHLGFVSGGGIGFSQHFFSDDTLLNTFPNLKKVSEHYNYINALFEMKFRISSGNQQKPFGKTNSVILDIGANYKFPFLFREVGRYEDDKKFVNKRLHQFTDLRAFVNFGYSPLIFYMEYRLSDFLIGNYTELPKYFIGIKLLMH